LHVNFEQLPTINALLNATATVLLVWGYWLIKGGRERAHQRVMLAAFGVSILFLACYLVYHFQVGSVPFRGPQPLRSAYYAMLLTHIVLAALVPFLAGGTIWLGLKDHRVRHVQLARWTFPIWLYVSVTGVLIYLVLYHVYPAPDAGSIMP
jgi:uncharacterized membrane protein YozB (DUF420 family)